MGQASAINKAPSGLDCHDGVQRNMSLVAKQSRPVNEATGNNFPLTTKEHKVTADNLNSLMASGNKVMNGKSIRSTKLSG